MQQTDATLKAWLTKAIAATGPYDPAALWAGAYQTVDNKGGLTALSDLAEGTGAVATRVEIDAWGTIYKMNDGRWAVDAPVATWVPASAAQAQIVRGSFLVSAAVAGTLKAFKPFDTPVQLLDENSHVSVIWRITIDPDGRFSANVVFNG